MEDQKIPMGHDFKGIGCSKIGYFKEVRKKLKELEKLNLKLAQRRNRLEAIFESINDGWTSTTYSSSPRDIPVLRHKCSA